jgi:hypothetical protein
MSPEAKKRSAELIQEMKTHIGGNAANQFAPISELLILITDDMDRQTQKIVRLTWGLFWLTVGLLAVSIVTLAIILIEHCSKTP